MNSIIPPKGSIPPSIRNKNSLYYRISQSYNSQYTSDYSPRIISQKDKKRDTGNTGNLRIYLRDELQRRLLLLEEEIRLCGEEGLNAENLTLEANLIREHLQYTW